jgi:hypothetical protein
LARHSPALVFGSVGLRQCDRSRLGVTGHGGAGPGPGCAAGIHLRHASQRHIAALSNREQAAETGTEWLWRLATANGQPPFRLLGRSMVHASPYVEFMRDFGARWQVVRPRDPLQRSAAPLLAIALAYAGRGESAAAAEM